MILPSSAAILSNDSNQVSDHMRHPVQRRVPGEGGWALRRYDRLRAGALVRRGGKLQVRSNTCATLLELEHKFCQFTQTTTNLTTQI